MYVLLYKLTSHSRWKCYENTFENREAAARNADDMKNHLRYYDAIVRYVEA